MPKTHCLPEKIYYLIKLIPTQALISCLLICMGILLISCGETDNGKEKLLYMKKDKNEKYQLWISENNNPGQQLTNEKEGIRNYAIFSDGSAIVYTANRPDGGTDIKEIKQNSSDSQLLVQCPENECLLLPNAVTSHQALVKIEISENDFEYYYIESGKNEMKPFFIEGKKLHQIQSLSEDGQWIVDYNDNKIRIISLSGNEWEFFSAISSPGSWNLTEGLFAFPSISFGDHRVGSRISVLNLKTGEVKNISNKDDHLNLFQNHTHDDNDDHPESYSFYAQDHNPVWSPDGKWIAFTRRPATTNAGAQLWMISPDGQEEIQLTFDPAYHCDLPQWSADSKSIAFVRYTLKPTPINPEIIIINIDYPENSPIIIDSGTNPRWF